MLQRFVYSSHELLKDSSIITNPGPTFATETEMGGEPISTTASSFPARILTLVAAVLQSGCLIFIFLNTFRVWLGLSAVSAASASFVHSAPVRYTLAILSLLGAGLTLGSVINAQYLRNLPSARWRRKPLTVKQKVENVVSVAASGLALLMVWYEFVLHHRLHP